MRVLVPLSLTLLSLGVLARLGLWLRDRGKDPGSWGFVGSFMEHEADRWKLWLWPGVVLTTACRVLQLAFDV